MGMPQGSMRNHLVNLLIYLFLATIFTLPAPISPGTGLLGYPGDNYQHAWFLWYFAKAITNGHNPFYTDLIFYPHGVNLSWSTLDPLAGILALPLSLSAGPVVTYNLSLVLQLALAAFFARLLCLKICRDQAAATVGGIAFGFSPFILAQALGHLSLVTAFPIPLYVLALDRVLGEENPSRKDGVVLGLALFLTAFANYNYTVFCLMFTAVIIIVDRILEGAGFLKRVRMPLCWASVTFLAGFSPVLIMLLGNTSDVPNPRTLEHVEKYSADALGFLIPSWNHLLLGSFSRTLDPRIFTAGFEGTVYVGPIALLLAAVGLWSRRIRQQRWATRVMLAGAVFYLLSLGPRIRCLGKPVGIPAPAYLLYSFRFARFLSAPARFHILTALCLSILASIGIAYLLDKLGRKWQRLCLVSVVGFMLIADTITIPFPTSSVVDPAWSPGTSEMSQGCELPSNLRSGTVLTFPLDWPYSLKSMWMQVSDNGRYSLIDGYVSYAPDRIWHEFYRISILRSLLSLQGKFSSPVDLLYDQQTVPDVVRELDLSAVVVFDSPQHDAGIHYMQTVFGRQGQNAGSCTVFEIAAPLLLPLARSGRAPDGGR
jgi:hypothetical protein